MLNMRHAWTECGACGITEDAKNTVVQELNEIKALVPVTNEQAAGHGKAWGAAMHTAISTLQPRPTRRAVKTADRGRGLGGDGGRAERRDAAARTRGDGKGEAAGGGGGGQREGG